MTDRTMREKDGSYPPFPLFIQLENVLVVVVGGGQVATRKIESLLDHGARVRVISDRITPEIERLVRDRRVELVPRMYRNGDLSGALLAVAATSNRQVNEAVYDEAHRRTILVNVVDEPDLCNCIVPSTLRRGNLQIAVSTGGAAPSVARDVRTDLENRFPDWWAEYIDMLGDVRSLVKERLSGHAELRSSMFEYLGGPDFRFRFAAGERPSPDDVYDELMREFSRGDIG